MEGTMTQKHAITIAVVGAGGRSSQYATRAARLPGVRIVAVAEPRVARRNRLGDEFGIPDDARFENWESLAQAGRIADAVIIGTQDALHRDPAVALAALGYNILLEKPMATSETDAIDIVEATERAGVLLMVCHVMRYMPLTTSLKAVLDSGRIGDVVTVEHFEPVGYWHFAHSFVRGPWSNEAKSSPALMSKSCHDLDWLNYIIGRKAERVSSFGRVHEFRPERKPEGAGERCLSCSIEPRCPYSAKRFYLPLLDDDRGLGDFLWGLTEDRSREGVVKALEEGPYGLCVYNSDNDVVDHQVVNIEYEGGVTAAFTMTAFTPGMARKTRICGTLGYIDTDFERIDVFDYLTETWTTVDVDRETDTHDVIGHGGGDEGIVRAFIEALRTGDAASNLTDARTSLINHQTVWAAERARREGRVVTIGEPLAPSAEPSVQQPAVTVA